jgi:predicted membrane channel-forming protein YqfA (hemolysin III family)
MSEKRTLVRVAVLCILFGTSMPAWADAGAYIGFPVLAGHILGVALVGVFFCFWRERKRIRLILFLAVVFSFVLTFVMLPSDETLWHWKLRWLASAGAVIPVAVGGLGFYFVRRSRRKLVNG